MTERFCLTFLLFHISFGNILFSAYKIPILPSEIQMAQRIKLGIPTSGGHCFLCREMDFSKRLLFGFDSLEVKMLSEFDRDRLKSTL